MGNDRLNHHLNYIEQIVNIMETNLKRLDLLELEILAIKTNIQKLHVAVCSIIGVLEGEDCGKFCTDHQHSIQSLQHKKAMGINK